MLHLELKERKETQSMGSKGFQCRWENSTHFTLEMINFQVFTGLKGSLDHLK